MRDDNSLLERPWGDRPKHCRPLDSAELGLLSAIDNPSQDNEFLIDTGFWRAL